jgi:hypothetical protein
MYMSSIDIENFQEQFYLVNVSIGFERAADYYNRSVNSRGASLLFGVWGVCVRLLLKISAELRFCEECLP